MKKSEEQLLSTPFPIFLEHFKLKLHEVFSILENNNYTAIKRGIPTEVFTEIMPLNPLSVIIPKQFGGRGGQVDESMLMISAAAYESLSFSLTLGINSALFLQPVIKYADEGVKETIFTGFLNDRKMGA